MGRVLVLCGATVPFEGLVAAFDESVLALLKANGYSEVEIQYGHAKNAFETEAACHSGVTGFGFDPNLGSRLLQADLVVSHAGTGSLWDALRSPNHPKVVAVINTALMDNHQTEVASKLAQESHIVMAESPAKLKDALLRVFTAELKPLPAPGSLAGIIPLP